MVYFFIGRLKQPTLKIPILCRFSKMTDTKIEKLFFVSDEIIDQ
jgi:hypothetical protein